MSRYPQKIFIISAARSGSKLLRDMIAKHPSVDAIPYDINYIWKIGNFGNHDELTVDDLSTKQRNKIRMLVEKQVSSSNGTVMLEKTVSNALRVEMVKSVFPEARFIHLHRDGRAVTLSALSCWNSSAVSSKNQSRSRYLLKLFRFPYLYSFPYFYNAIRERLKYKLGMSNALPLWGPVYAGIRQDQQRKSDLQVCAVQWSRCVARALASLQKMSEGKDYISVSYEALVSDPRNELKTIFDFIGLQAADEEFTAAASMVNPDYREKWKSDGFAQQLQTISEIIRPQQILLGYENERIIE